MKSRPLIIPLTILALVLSSADCRLRSHVKSKLVKNGFDVSDRTLMGKKLQNACLHTSSKASIGDHYVVSATFDDICVSIDLTADKTDPYRVLRDTRGSCACTTAQIAHEPSKDLVTQDFTLEDAIDKVEDFARRPGHRQYSLINNNCLHFAQYLWGEIIYHKLKSGLLYGGIIGSSSGVPSSAVGGSSYLSSKK
eukprot:CAMPEP_0115027492 /NCGR_PEP_ID=MMETSP0216-20121206/35565_1 /TAXON_ID=223996 /ORGANISM="Protocruzia adherens, Strain Boccale" /LENGTH=194 /DNA_ID=CAMNT_0002403151 /DNA_START=34 /DNA_END=618 /DNA_ORIENTATION=+